MAKLKNVTDEEIIDAIDGLWSLDDPDLPDIANRIQKGYCDNLPKLPNRLRSLARISREIAELSVALWMQYEMQEQRREIEELKAKQRAS